MIKNFDHTYLNLPSQMYSYVDPAIPMDPKLIAYNEKLDEDLNLGLSHLHPQTLADIFSGKTRLDGAGMFATVYAGHQFGHFNPQLGDGRAIMIGEVVNDRGQRFDMQLKGSGQTPYSRRGDGKSPLGPVIREYLVSEAMSQLGVPTTRALAFCTTGDRVFREHVLAGGVFTRVAKSHLRVGTWQYFLFKGEKEDLQTIVDYSIDRLGEDDVKHAENKYLKFLKQVIHKQCLLVAKWKAIGFIHGVMNTDNTSLSGETIDYGPCAFMDTFRQNQVYSFIDNHGRYAYHNKESILRWNFYRLGECLIPLVHEDEKKSMVLIEDELSQIEDVFQKFWKIELSKKFAVSSDFAKLDQLSQYWFEHLEKQELDFTNSFRKLTDYFENDAIEDQAGKIFADIWTDEVKKSFASRDDIEKAIKLANPYLIPRNHLVEECIEKSYQGDFSMFYELHEAYKTPYSEKIEYKKWANPPSSEQVVLNTFCGT